MRSFLILLSACVLSVGCTAPQNAQSAPPLSTPAAVKPQPAPSQLMRQNQPMPAAIDLKDASPGGGGGGPAQPKTNLEARPGGKLQLPTTSATPAH